MTSVKNRKEWSDGLTRLENEKYWLAHESFEDIWRTLPDESSEREVLQALIQFAAACYKCQQVSKDGKTEAGMKRGMKALIESGRGHLDDGEEVGDHGLESVAMALREGFGRLEDIHHDWQNEEGVASIQQRVARVARGVASA
jgi:predicted metal-dependent hydrolase